MMKGINSNSSHTVDRIPENSIGVELGVWQAHSSKLFEKKTKKLHLVDSWAVQPYLESPDIDYFAYINRYSGLVGSSNPEDFQKYYDKVYSDVVKMFSKNENVFIHRMTTDEWFEKNEELVDWIYVDAAHDKNGCYKDLVNSFNLLKKAGSGLIFGDDYGNKAGVTEAVDAFVKDYGLKLNNFYKNQYEIKVE